MCDLINRQDEKIAAIHKALDECSAEHPVFYEDEVDIHMKTVSLFPGGKHGLVKV